ncbi:ankyrin repeat domain-containing protein SOWAHB [Ictalurus punctatus]|uniref:Ankyrin repeat domain-containing protein SOWAHA n=1 Tax=Ictalurus punctatus TaxID=7998 RepID=W5U9V7_ICTPU|nr:ankyrin repeat domain-containing protein SOWAHB [Ictalurus punctatus]
MALTQTVVLSFLMTRGGKVKNTELLSAFTAHINCSEPEQRRRNRDLFKSFINNVAVVKRVDDVKYVVVKKKYQEMINEGKFSIASSPSSSPSSSSCRTQQSCFSRCESRSITSADILNNNSWFCTSPPGCSINTSKDLVTKQQLQSRPAECDAVIAPVSTSNQEESLTARVLNVANNTRKGKTGAVFAVVAIKSPPHSQTEKIQVNLRTPACLQRLEIPPQQELKTVEAGKSSPYLNHEPDLNKSSRTKRRQTVVPSSPALKRGNKVRKPGFSDKDSSAIRLEPREHEWLVMSATGRWSQLYNLLLQDVLLAEKRNFISGFTALHWAAKHGNVKMVRRILDIGEKVDVNIKSHDGYTPLHVAAIHSHESVLNLLVRDYGANCHIRDNSGKKAYQYLRKELSAEVRELLGDPAASCQFTQHACSDDQHFSDLSKNLNTFSKLFQSSVGHRKKSRLRSSFRSISDEQEENKKDCSLDH